jgi:hypothetical protein
MALAVSFPIELFLFEVSTTTLSINKNLYAPQGITCNPWPEGCGGCVILENIISRIFNYVEQNGYIKLLIGCVWGNSGCERDVSYPSMTFDY